MLSFSPARGRKGVVCFDAFHLEGAPRPFCHGAAVVVFPGGGYSILAIDLEGTEACDWLTSRGITCVLLKYRVPDSGPAWHDDCQCRIHPKAPTALKDAQRTIWQ
jgi:hypothetical protein